MGLRIRRRSNREMLVFDEQRDLLGAGGEGAVYRTTRAPHLVAKLYHLPDSRSPKDQYRRHAERLKERSAKIPIMVAHPPSDDATPGHRSIAWPVDVLDDDSGHFRGFLMYKLSKSVTLYEVLNPRKRSKTSFQNYTLEQLLGVASNLVSAFAALHDAGYVIGDVNESNALVTDRGLVTVIDTDSFQVRGNNGHTFRCPVGKPEFTPPELHGAPFSDIDRNAQHDLFGLGVLLFQLVMEGWHPFNGTPDSTAETWTLGKRIAHGNFPYGKYQSPIAPPRKAPRQLSHLHPRMQRLFLQCFDRSRAQIKQRTAPKRPDTSAWQDALDVALNELTTCSVDSSHVYSAHLSSCPECELQAGRAARQRRAALGVQRAVSSPSGSLAAAVPLAAPPPMPAPPPAPVAEIQPGVWRLRLLDQVAQAYAMLLSVEQLYHLAPNGQMHVEAVFHMPMQGMNIPVRGDGRWSYDVTTKILTLQGLLQAQVDMGNPFLAMSMPQLPPQQVSSQLKLESGSGGRYYVWDMMNNSRHIFERVK